MNINTAQSAQLMVSLAKSSCDQVLMVSWSHFTCAN